MTQTAGPMIAGVDVAFPPYRYPQDRITDAFAAVCLGADGNHELARRLHASSRVGSRNLALPLEAYAGLDGFTAANDVFLDVGVDLGGKAVRGALAAAGLDGSDVDLIVSTTVTGVAAPSLDARMAGAVGLRADVKRTPMFGLGCVAGAAGVARLHDHLVGHPDDVAVLLSVELCSLTIQRDDRSVANLVACGLFGDGASAAVAVGARKARELGLTGPVTVASRAHLYPDTQRTMGWDVGSSGLKIVLGAEVPELVRRYLGDDVREFLSDHDLKIDDVTHWISHPGGPKVIEAIEDVLGLPDDALGVTWRSLADVGNLSSSSVLHVLSETLRERPFGPGDVGVLMAMGPGFCSEMVLLNGPADLSH